MDDPFNLVDKSGWDIFFMAAASSRDWASCPELEENFPPFSGFGILNFWFWLFPLSP